MFSISIDSLSSSRTFSSGSSVLGVEAQEIITKIFKTNNILKKYLKPDYKLLESIGGENE